MKERAILQARFDEFALRFLLPLTRGGETEIGDPIGPGAIDHFVDATPTDSALADELAHAIAQRIAQTFEGTPQTTVGADEIRLAAALHNLIWSSHPDLAKKKKARATVAAWTSDILHAVAPPTTVESAVLRHAVVGRFDDLARRDTTVSTWAYRYRFPGRAPPPRLVALPSVRRVHQEVTHAPFSSLALDSDATTLLSLFVRRTPLTAALRPTLVRPPFRWHAQVVDVLQDVSLCRAATYAWVEAWARIPDVAGAALAALAEEKLDPPRLAFVVCFHYNLLLTFAHVSGDQTAERLMAQPGFGPEAPLFYGTLFAAFQAMDALRAPLLPVPDSERAEMLQAFASAAGDVSLGRGAAIVEAAAGGIG